MKEFAREKLLAMGNSDKDAWVSMLEVGVSKEDKNYILTQCFEFCKNKHSDKDEKIIALQILYEHGTELKKQKE